MNQETKKFKMEDFVDVFPKILLSAEALEKLKSAVISEGFVPSDIEGYDPVRELKIISKSLKNKNYLKKQVYLEEIACEIVCKYFKNNTGYDTNWVLNLIYKKLDNKNGRPKEYTETQKIIICAFIDLLISKNASNRQSRSIIEGIFGISTRELKRSYPIYKKNKKDLLKLVFGNLSKDKLEKFLITDVILQGNLNFLKTKKEKAYFRTIEIFHSIIENHFSKIKRQINNKEFKKAFPGFYTEYKGFIDFINKDQKIEYKLLELNKPDNKKQFRNDYYTFYNLSEDIFPLIS